MNSAPRKDTYDQTTDIPTKRGSNDKVNSELQAILKKGELKASDIVALRNKYNNDESVVDEVLYLYGKRWNKIKKEARKAAEKIYSKYSSGNRPLHEILQKMLKYKVEHHWTDAEFDQFRREVSQRLSNTRPHEVEIGLNNALYRSRINRVLGVRYPVEETLRINESEQGVLQEILKTYESSKKDHSDVIMQSLMYEDCSIQAMSGEYKAERHLASSHIHPILACMFLPKIDIFDVHMLYSNIGSIVKARKEGRGFLTEPDLILYNDLISDPNDVVCEISSAITDLKNRYKVQVNLWRTILRLREGRYYESDSASDFLQWLNVCRNNLYDNADIIYNQDEGSILRRLFSVFSLRPTIISIRSIFTTAPMGMFGYSMATPGISYPDMTSIPFSNQMITTVTAIPMISLHLKPTFNEGSEPINLISSTQQVIWINENKQIVPKEKQIIYSKEVLIFYINRRVQRLSVRTYASPLTFSQMPLTMSSFERLNAYPVHIPDRIPLAGSDDLYLLRSAVCVTETQIIQGKKVSHLITGSTGLIMVHSNTVTTFEPRYYIYDPYGASIPVANPIEDKNTDGKTYFNNKPISFGSDENVYDESGNLLSYGFFERIGKSGTIMIYCKPGGYSPYEVINI